MAREIIIQVTGEAGQYEATIQRITERTRQLNNTAVQGAQRTTSAFSQAMSVMVKLPGVLGSIAGAFGAAFGAGAIIAFTKNVIDAAGKIDDLSKRTGFSRQTLSGLKSTIEENGSTLEAFATAVNKAQRSLADIEGDGKKAAQALASMGLDVKKLQSSSPEKFFEQFAESLSKVEGQNQRVAIATRVMGKAGAEQIPVILELADKFQDLRQRGVSDQAIKLLDKFGDAITRLKNQVIGFMQEKAIANFLNFFDKMFGISESAQAENAVTNASRRLAAIDAQIKGIENSSESKRNQALRGFGFSTPDNEQKLLELQEKRTAAAADLLNVIRQLDRIQTGELDKPITGGAGGFPDEEKIKLGNRAAEAVAKLNIEQQKLNVTNLEAALASGRLSEALLKQGLTIGDIPDEIRKATLALIEQEKQAELTAAANDKILTPALRAAVEQRAKGKVAALDAAEAERKYKDALELSKRAAEGDAEAEKQLAAILEASDHTREQLNQRMLEAIEMQRQLGDSQADYLGIIGKTEVAERARLENLIAYLEKLKDFEKLQGKDTENLRLQQIQNAQTQLQKLGTVSINVGQTIANALGDAFQGVILGTSKLADVGKNLFTALLRDVGQFFTQTLLKKVGFENILLSNVQTFGPQLAGAAGGQGGFLSAIFGNGAPGSFFGGNAGTANWWGMFGESNADFGGGSGGGIFDFLKNIPLIGQLFGSSGSGGSGGSSGSGILGGLTNVLSGISSLFNIGSTLTGGQGLGGLVLSALGLGGGLAAGFGAGAGAAGIGAGLGTGVGVGAGIGGGAVGAGLGLEIANAGAAVAGSSSLFAGLTPLFSNPWTAIIAAIVIAIASIFGAQKPNPTVELASQFSGIFYDALQDAFKPGNVKTKITATQDIAGSIAGQVKDQFQQLLEHMSKEWTEILNIFPGIVRERLIPLLDETNAALNQLHERIKFSEGGSRTIAEEMTAALKTGEPQRFFFALRKIIGQGFVESLKFAGFGDFSEVAATAFTGVPEGATRAQLFHLPGLTPPRKQEDLEKFVEALQSFAGITGALASLSPAFNAISPTSGTPEIPAVAGTPFISAREIARLTFLEQMGRETVSETRLDRFIRESERRGITFEDQLETAGLPAIPGTPGTPGQFLGGAEFQRGAAQFLTASDVAALNEQFQNILSITDANQFTTAVGDLQEKITPVLEFLQKSVQETTDIFGRGMVAALQAATESDALTAFKGTLGAGIKEIVFKGVTEAFIASAQFNDLLAPIQQTIRDFTQQAIVSGVTPDINAFRTAILPDIEEITTRAETLLPLIGELQKLGLNVDSALAALTGSAGVVAQSLQQTTNIFGSGLIAALDAATDSQALVAFKQTLGEGIKDLIFNGITEGFIASAQFTDLLKPIQDTIGEFIQRSITTGESPDIEAFRRAILPELGDVTARADLLAPLIAELQKLGFDFKEALGLISAPTISPNITINIAEFTGSDQDVRSLGIKIGDQLRGLLSPS